MTPGLESAGVDDGRNHRGGRNHADAGDRCQPQAHFVFILKCVAPDMATFQDFVTHLTAAPHVRNVGTSLVLHNSKYEAAVPLG